MTKFTQIKSYNDNFFRNKINLQLQQKNVTVTQFDELMIMVRRFCGQVFDNLSEFPYLYFTSGITQAIDFLVSQEITHVQRSDYRYLFTLPNSVTNESLDRMYWSYPFSSSGRFESLPSNGRIILDCAYIFASNLKCIKSLPVNVEQVLFSVSKGHNLWDLRCGWMFSRSKIPCYHIAQIDYNYISILNFVVFESIINYPVNFLYQKYQQQFSELYKKHRLDEPDTNLFGLQNKNRLPYYSL